MKNDILKLISLADRFKVIEKSDGYEIESKNSDLGAYIYKDNKIEYFVTGVYNSGLNWAEIEINELLKLKKFCESMVEGGAE